jgi:AraC-like DNA-binding protein
VRIRAIEELAAGDTPVTEIACMAGYSSLPAFSPAFHELAGRTPTGYRASFRP